MIYEGKYFSDETNSSLIIQGDNGKLMIHVKPNADYPLKPAYKDAFTIDTLGWDLQFIKSPEKKNPRAKNKPLQGKKHRI